MLYVIAIVISVIAFGFYVWSSAVANRKLDIMWKAHKDKTNQK